MAKVIMDNLSVWLAGARSEEELKRMYRVLAQFFHPDRGGNTSLMQELNIEYEYRQKQGGFQLTQKANIITEYIHHYCPNVEIRLEGGELICPPGTETYNARETLKTIGFRWDAERRVWFYSVSV